MLAVYLSRVKLFNQMFQGRHPAWSKMTILKEDPLALFYCKLHHLLCYGTLQKQKKTHSPIWLTLTALDENHKLDSCCQDPQNEQLSTSCSIYHGRAP